MIRDTLSIELGCLLAQGCVLASRKCEHGVYETALFTRDGSQEFHGASVVSYDAAIQIVIDRFWEWRRDVVPSEFSSLVSRHG